MEKYTIDELLDVLQWARDRAAYYRACNKPMPGALYAADCKAERDAEAEFWVDSHGVFHASMPHHDGTNYVVFKAWKDGVTDEQKENVMDALYCGKCTNRMLRRYTRNLGGEIAKVYGWRVSTGKKEA